MNEYSKILVVDDEFIMRQGITHMIDWEKEGFQIIGQASNGQEAIDMIKENIPDIIISDVVMPQINGIELAKFLQDKYPQIKIIILSSYSDFEYVKSSFQNGAVDYILKPSLNPTEILKTLKKLSNKLKSNTSTKSNKGNTNNILSRLILGFDTNIDIDYLNNLFVYSNFCLFGLNAKKIYDNYEKRQDIISYTDSVINNEFSLNKLDISYCIQTANIENEIIVTVINFDNNSYRDILNKINKISQLVSNSFYETFFVMTNNFDSINNVKSIYEKEFLLLTQQYFYHRSTPLLCSQDFKAPPQIDKFNFKRFSEFVSIMQFQNAFEMLTRYIQDAINNTALTEFELKTLIQNSFYNVITSLEYLNFDSNALNSLKQDCFHKIDSIKYAEDLIKAYESLLSHLNEIIDKHENRINSHMINKIIQYIHDHYDEQLTLAEVSKLFNFNYSYLSAYFSSHNEEGFNEFLNKIRIKKACDFLKQDIPISDISSMVGYSDHSYFCKVFKKFTGLTPSNFRKSGIKILD
ncbi:MULTISPECIES: response regulator [unclassified Clostridium]|uniref:response regulator transcription factor n=1 Tax=unclassified Clostridium TaxID=2614128 RepID=UPI00029817D4|nr:MULTISPECIES: response regulator [unclassified Clostridium]EKQ57577.1 MAG: response regulator (CheY-like and AraC-type DNA-binding domain containing protein) [Clostridium sp. Maddingley MBC34-26]